MNDWREESGPTFENFVTTRGAAKALELSKTLASGRRQAPRLLVFHGPPGVGKTHLLRAITHAARLGPPSVPVIQTSAMELVQEMIALVRRDPAADRRQIWAANALVTVDDLHVLKGMVATQREVGLSLRAALDRGSRLACAAGCGPSEVPVLFQTLRAAPGVRLLELRRPRGADMRRILSELLTKEGLSLSAKALASTAARCQGDVRRAVSSIAHWQIEVARRSPSAGA